MSAPEPVVNVDDPTDRGFARVPERVARSRPGWRWGVHRGGRSSGCGSPPPSPTGSRSPGGCLEAGRISGYQALIAAGESQRLTDAECSVFEHRVYPRGESQTPARFRRACRLVAAALHPEHLEAAHAEAKKQTDVTKWVEDAGMASLRLLGPGSGDHRDLGVGEHRSPRPSPGREESRRGVDPDRGTPHRRVHPVGQDRRHASAGPRDHPRRDRLVRPDRTTVTQQMSPRSSRTSSGRHEPQRSPSRRPWSSSQPSSAGDTEPGRGQQAREPEPARVSRPGRRRRSSSG